MKHTTVDIYYYSSTGNTLLVTEELAAVLRQNGYSVTLYAIEHTDPAAVRTDRTIGLAFPVAFQSTFPFVWDFFKKLPPAEGTEVFMIDTMMAFSGAIVGPLKKELHKKGYDCIGAKEFIMPSNFFPKKINRQKDERLKQNTLKKVRDFATDLVSGKTTWNRIPLLSDLFYQLCCNDFMMDNVCLAPGKKITIDRQLCTGCSLCVKLCPTGALSMNGNRVCNEEGCQVCMRCMSFCPSRAISVVGSEFERYRAVSVKKLTPKKRRDRHEIS